MRLTRTLFVAASIGVAVCSAAHAAIAYALTDDNSLLGFDTATPSSTISAVILKSPTNTAIQDIIGIDFRPSNATLYGVGKFGAIYTINPLTGVSTQVASLNDGATPTANSVALIGSRFGFDFNPQADRLRITSDADQNLRVNVATGVTIVDGTITFGGGNPNIVSSAYTNNVAGALSTTLYAIDTVTDQLYVSTSPNAGTYVAVGALGFDATALSGFDITTIGGVDFAYAALLSANSSGSKLYSINLATGAATAIGTIGGGDFADGLAIVPAAVPEPVTLAGLVGGAAVVTFRRRRLANV